MRSLLTRREITALFAAAPLAAQVTNVPPAGSPQPAAPSADSQQRLAKAYADVRAVSGQLAAIEVPMNVEPAFLFRV